MTPSMTDGERSVTTEDDDFSDSDFAAIEAAVMETSRGRWFLREFARRNRHANTDDVLEAVARLADETLPRSRRAGHGPSPRQSQRLRGDPRRHEAESRPAAAGGSKSGSRPPSIPTCR